MSRSLVRQMLKQVSGKFTSSGFSVQVYAKQAEPLCFMDSVTCLHKHLLKQYYRLKHSAV